MVPGLSFHIIGRRVRGKCEKWSHRNWLSPRIKRGGRSSCYSTHVVVLLNLEGVSWSWGMVVEVKLMATEIIGRTSLGIVVSLVLAIMRKIHSSKISRIMIKLQRQRPWSSCKQSPGILYKCHGDRVLGYFICCSQSSLSLADFKRKSFS